MIREINDVKTKKQNEADKSHSIRVYLEDYALELKANLAKVEGIENKDISAIIDNELMGVVQYIN